MTTKYLTGAYPGGYTLSAAYTGLDIEATASVGGNGVSAAFYATIQNDGTINAAASVGVYLHAGGIVTNGSATETTALMEGYHVGLVMTGSGAVTNFGTIIGTEIAIYAHGSTTITNFGAIAGGTIRLEAGGIVTNGSPTDTTALIDGGFYAPFIAGTAAPGAAVTIHSPVNLRNGGTVTNGSATDTAALVRGQIFINRQTAITNFGTIFHGGKGKRNDAILLIGGGSVVNGSTADTQALIEGATGLYAYRYFGGPAFTITNFGTISGITGVAVQLGGKGNVLRVEAGSVFRGAVLGGGGTLDLASGEGMIGAVSGGNVTVSGHGRTTTFSNFGTLELAKGTGFTLSGTAVIASGGTGTLVADGALTVTGSLTVNGTLSGRGGVALSGAAFVEVDNATPSTLSITFKSAATATLALKTPAQFAATISGFAAGETIDLVGIAADSAVVNGSDQLVIDNGTTSVATLQLTGSYAGDTFTTASDGHGGTAITVSGGAAVAPVHGFVAAMAALSPAAGASHLPGLRLEEALRPLLVSPRAALA
jgi:hypothetical protein